MDVKIAQKLREPFPPEYIGKLPRITCPDCSKGRCQEHQRGRCDECGNYISPRHIHLDYVGHADVTARLLEADPEWTWEPLASDEQGLPVCDTDDNRHPVGMWIKLTVGGVTRLGYGSCPSGQNDAVKVLIGDALRNAAMRFGVAVDLWAKGDRADPTAENATSSAGQAQKRSRAKAADAPVETTVSPISAARAELLQAAKETGHGSDPATIGQHFETTIGKPVQDAGVDELKTYVAHLRETYAKEQGEKVGAAS